MPPGVSRRWLRRPWSFTDPNGCELPADTVCSTSAVRGWINVIDRTDMVLWLPRTPDTAHCSAWNRTVIGLIARGHRVGQPLPEVPIVSPPRVRKSRYVMRLDIIGGRSISSPNPAQIK
jgi:hypothetical protein